MVRGWTILLLWLATLGVALGSMAPLFVHTFYFLTALIAAAYLWSWSGVRGLQVDRRVVLPRAQLGGYIEERFLIRNGSLVPKLWLEVKDTSELPMHRGDRVLSALPPGQERGWSVRTQVLRRGRYRLGPMRLTSGDPFGLFTHRRVVEAYSSVTVYPYLFAVPTLVPPSGQLSGGQDVRARLAPLATNVMGVRDYAPGDTVSRIHWRSTAHHGRLMVKEFELDPQVQVWIFLDLDLRSQRRRQHSLPEEPDPLFRPRQPVLRLLDSTEEYGVSVAASLARYFASRGQAVGLVTHGPGRLVLQPDRGDRQVLRMLDALAVVEARAGYPFHRLLAQEGARLPRSATLLAVTPSVEPDWVAALKMLQGRGLRAMAVVIEASTFAQAESPMRVLGNLAAAGVPCCSLGYGQELGPALAAAAGRRSGGRVGQGG